jgi:hypothetical protein
MNYLFVFIMYLKNRGILKNPFMMTLIYGIIKKKKYFSYTTLFFSIRYLELLHLLSHFPELKSRFKNTALSHNIQHFSSLANSKSQFFISLSRQIKSSSNFKNVLSLLEKYHGTTILSLTDNNTGFHHENKKKILKNVSNRENNIEKENKDTSLKVIRDLCTMEKPLIELEQFTPLLCISSSPFPLLPSKETALPVTNVSNPFITMTLNNVKNELQVFYFLFMFSF